MTGRVSLAVCTLTILCIAACSKTPLTSGPERGTAERDAPELVIQYGCTTCHLIPHVPGAAGKVGPSLASVSQRSYLAGSFPNTPENLERWIMHPQRYRPGTAMPEMGVSEQDAHAIAAFLEGEP